LISEVKKDREFSKIDDTSESSNSKEFMTFGEVRHSYHSSSRISLTVEDCHVIMAALETAIGEWSTQHGSQSLIWRTYASDARDIHNRLRGMLSDRSRRQGPK
jgi:hypothetical protein